jgi:probable rRNA maturation factor
VERWGKYKSNRVTKNSCGIIVLSISPKITLYNGQRDIPLSIPKLRKVVSFLLKELEISTDEIIVHFVSERKISLLHKKFFDDPSSTDCITFPIDSSKKEKGSYHILGEAFICPKIALEYSERHQIDPFEELHRYIIHCILHLVGYNDLHTAERARMKKKERIYLKKLYQHNLLYQIFKD